MISLPARLAPLVLLLAACSQTEYFSPPITRSDMRVNVRAETVQVNEQATQETTEAANTKADAEDVSGAASEGPYGPDSAEPAADGGAPEGFTVKGNANSMKYHVAGSQWYDSTEAEVWFRTGEAAESAGFEPAGGPSAQEVDDTDS